MFQTYLSIDKLIIEDASMYDLLKKLYFLKNSDNFIDSCHKRDYNV